ncbi:MAG: hypothetical protein ACI4SP_04245, partial [Eubacteriales bacterium]
MHPALYCGEGFGGKSGAMRRGEVFRFVKSEVLSHDKVKFRLATKKENPYCRAGACSRRLAFETQN